MYLSRVKIDTSNRFNVKQLDHLGAYHSWVEDSFPDELTLGFRTRKLWRIDEMDHGHYLLVLSQEKPDLIKLEKYGVAKSAETKKYDVLLEQLKESDKLRFCLVLNPVKSLSQGKNSGNRGRVIPLVTAEQQIQYLEGKALQNGFSINNNEVIVTNKSFELLKRKKQKPLKICKATYEGILKIENLDNFKNCLINGIGKKKAYGCGLLTVIPGSIL